MTALIRRAALAFSMLTIASPLAWADNNGVPPAMMNGASAPAVTKGTCSGMTVIEHIEDTSPSQSTSSTAFVNVPSASVGFAQGTAGCVVATFSASTFAPGNSRLMYVEAVIDGGTVAAPGAVLFSGADNALGFAEARAYSFVFTGVKAGAHVVQIRYRSANGAPVFLSKHSLVVTHS